MNSLKLIAALLFFGFTHAQHELDSSSGQVQSLCSEELNEFYDEYPSACPQTCEYYNKLCPIQSVALPGCYCMDGYVRDGNNNCVEADPYCANCTVNEYFSISGPACEECEYVNKECDRWTLVIPRGCFCIEGYARDENGTCIPIEQCPSKL